MVWQKNHFAYMKDERPNLNTMIIALKFVVNCDTLGVEESFQKKWFGHFFVRHISMQLLTKKCVKALYMFLTNLSR